MVASSERQVDGPQRWLVTVGVAIGDVSDFDEFDCANFGFSDDDTARGARFAEAFGLRVLFLLSSVVMLATLYFLRYLRDSNLDAAEAAEFLSDLGILEPALNQMIRASYGALDLQSFFTVGEDECRAWSIRSGTPAVEAGGVIHSDIQRGFIRAEVVPSDELLETGSLSGCRQKGSDDAA